MQQHVAALEHVEHAFELLLRQRSIGQPRFLGPCQRRSHPRLLGFIFELGQWQAGEAEQIIQTKRAFDPVEVFSHDGHPLHQQLHHVLGHVMGDFKPHHLTAHAAFAQPLLQGAHQIVGFELPQLQVGIAGDAEDVVPFDGHPREQQLQVESHHLLQRNGAVDHSRFVVAELTGQFQKAGQVLLRHLHPRELLHACFRVAYQGGDVEAEVADEWEGVGRIHRQGCEHRKDGVAEVFVHPFPLGLAEVGVIQHLHAMTGQLGLQGLAVVVLLLGQQGTQLGLNGLQLLQRQQAIHAWFLDALLHL